MTAAIAPDAMTIANGSVIVRKRACSPSSAIAPTKTVNTTVDDPIRYTSAVELSDRRRMILTTGNRPAIATKPYSGIKISPKSTGAVSCP